MTTFPTDDQTLQLLHEALHPAAGADRTSVGDLIDLYGEMNGVNYHVNDVLTALLTEVRDRRALDGPIALAEARGRVEAYAQARALLRAELRGAPHNAPAQTQLTYVGGLARARRMIERLYRAAMDAEEQLVLASADPEPGR